MKKKTPLLSEMLLDMDGGVFDQKCGAFLATVASQMSNYGGKGAVRITLLPKRIGNGNQLLLVHTVEFNAPTSKGQMTERDVTETPMHVHSNGVLSLFPAETTPDMFRKQDQAEQTNNPAKEN